MKKVILTFDAGGMCNRIFPFANALAACAEVGWDLTNPAFKPYAEYFMGTATLSKMKNPPKSRIRLDFPFWEKRYAVARRLTQNNVLRVGETERLDLGEVLKKRKKTNQTLWVNALYVLDNENFLRHADMLRAFFQPVPELQSQLNAFMFTAKQNVDLLVGVHIRQGDYKHHDSGILYYETDEYVQLMTEMQELHPNRKIRFLVASDQNQEPEQFKGLDWIMAPGSEVLDLYALAACDYIMGPPSTYSQWASFFGKVPRYVHDRKGHKKSGRFEPAKILLEQFHIHECGFGRYA